MTLRYRRRTIFKSLGYAINVVLRTNEYNKTSFRVSDILVESSLSFGVVFYFGDQFQSLIVIMEFTWICVLDSHYVATLT